MTIPETFIINLDLPPDERWRDVVDEYKDKFPRVIQEIDKILASSGYLGNIVLWICNIFTFFGSIMYKQELKSIARMADIPLNKLILMQICYEMFSACTSLVMKRSDDTNVHFRTMDWEMDFLKDLTINVNFIRNGKSVFRGVTWAGYVGIVTGMNSYYSVALNYRRSNGTLMNNFMRTIAMKWPVGYLVRHTLENSWNKYEEALNIFSKYQLISPCYITLCSADHDAVVIVRECDRVVQVRYLNSMEYIVQTNCDDDRDPNNIMWSHERVGRVRQIMNSFSVDGASVQKIFETFDGDPIINSHTIYKSVLIPKENVLESRVV